MQETQETGDVGLIPGSGRSPGEGKGNPLQHSVLSNPTDRGVWQATVHGVAKSRIQLSTRVELFGGQLVITFHLKKTDNKKQANKKSEKGKKELGSSPHDPQLCVQMG